MEKELRKHKINLGISGAAVIVFGVWTIVKILIYFFASTEDFFSLFGAMQILDPAERAITITIFIVLVLIDLGLRLFIGLSARAESKGKKKSVVYLIFAALMILGSVFLNVFFASDLFTGSILDGIISIILECTSVLAFVEVIVSSVGIRRTIKKLD